MQCPQCQHENPTGQKFCGECGARLKARCSACGTVNPPGQKFCGECGERLAGTAAAPQPAPPSPASYTPQHLAERIISSRGALEGERKQVTVLFADLKGSTELIQGLDPEDARGLLDPALHAMMAAVHRYEGTVNQVLGDGIMALFGAPLAHEDHAARACYAALALQEALHAYAEQVRRSHGVELQARVGLNSGEVVVRAIGNDLHMDYTAVGETTHLAARMEQTAAPGTIRLTAGTLRLAEGFVEVRPLGPVSVKGVPEPLEVFELLNAGAARTRLEVGAARGLTQFIGRDTELAAFHETLARAAQGRGQVLALVGEPGVGKSRLVRETAAMARDAGWRVLETGAVSYGTATPYLPVADLLRSYFGVQARDDPATARQRVVDGLLALEPALTADLPALLALLDLGTDDPDWQALDPLHRRRQTLDAIKRLLLRESQEQALLLVFEDLHWIDSETQALLDSLVESLPAARLLLLVNYRPEYEHRWGTKSYYAQLRLDALHAESAERLLQALLGDDAALDSLRQRLIAQTDGNPLFLEESVRTLVETQVLIGDKGAYRLARALAQIQVPATVQAVLAARIDRLPPDDKHLLQSAAVIGKDVPVSLLAAVAEQTDEALSTGLVHLRAAEFLYEAAVFPELEYTFKHALTHDVTYQGLLQERRRALHGRIVAAIETLHTARLEEQVERLAHHALRGEVWDKALAYWRQAGLRALARSVHRDAAAAFENALLALEHLPATPERLGQAVDIRLDFPRTLIPLGEIERLLERLREAEAIAERLVDDRRLGRVAAFQTGSYWWVGDYARAIAAGQRALTLAGAVDDLAIRVVGSYYLAMAHVATGDHRQGAAILEQTTALLVEEVARERFGGAGYPATMTRAWRAWSLAELGEFATAVSLAQEAVRIAEEFDHPYSLTHACLELGGVHVCRGESEQAIPVLERGLRLCRTWDIPIFFAGIAARLGLAYVLVGRVAEALPLLSEAGAQTTVPGLLIYPAQAQTAGVVAEALLWAKCADRGLAEHALELARARHERGHAAWALRLFGEITTQADPPNAEQAEAYYRQGLALADELGMRPLAAHCHLGLGTLYQKVGRDEEATAKLATAAEMYCAMEMPSWLAKAQAALPQVNA
jgi:class 3 adenylate cyclase/tetratricopeptide (TPR) repeat protein